MLSRAKIVITVYLLHIQIYKDALLNWKLGLYTVYTFLSCPCCLMLWYFNSDCCAVLLIPWHPLIATLCVAERAEQIKAGDICCGIWSDVWCRREYIPLSVQGMLHWLKHFTTSDTAFIQCCIKYRRKVLQEITGSKRKIHTNCIWVTKYILLLSSEQNTKYIEHIQVVTDLCALDTELHRVSKKTSKIVFVITTSNFHQIWQFLAQWWQIV